MMLVYVIRAGNFTKIGIAEDVAKRLQVFRTHSPIPVELVYSSPRMLRPLARELEIHCHSELMEFHSHGEWFEVSSDMAIDVLNKKIGHFAGVKTPTQLELVA